MNDIVEIVCDQIRQIQPYNEQYKKQGSMPSKFSNISCKNHWTLYMVPLESWLCQFHVPLLFDKKTFYSC